MNRWHSKSLGDGMWAPVVRIEIEEMFQPLFNAANQPVEMAVFMREEAGRLHCEWIAYFSPAAQSVAEALGANPCGKPAKAGLSLLAGGEGCWPALFVEEGV